MSYVLNFYSGVEPEHHYKAACWAGVQNMLMSYLYLIKNPSGLLAERHALTPNVKFMIDSGAHTLQGSMTKAPFNKWKMRDIEQFLENYLRYIDSHREAIYCAVELDIAYPINVVNGRTSRDPYGTSVVNSWRRDYFEPLMAKGMNIVFVWHTPEGHLGWEDMCAKYPYVGLPGEMSSQMDFGNYLAVAQRYTTKIHGFAATKMKDFKEIPWYSIDSSVAGDSRLLMRHKGKFYRLTIEELYTKGEGRKVSPNEYVASLPNGWETLTIDDDLKSVWKPVPYVIKHTVRKSMYKLHLTGGKSIQGTGDHSYFTLNPLGELVEVKPSDMKKGDFIVGSANVALPEDLRPGFEVAALEFLGVWFGDGYVDMPLHSLNVSKQHLPEIARLTKKFAASLGAKYGLKPNGFDCQIYAPETAARVAALFGRVGSEKHICEEMFSWDRSAVAAFLRGYFSADGTAKARSIQLSCKHRHVMEDVQQLLEMWDIRSNLCTKHSDGGFCPHTSTVLSICDAKSKAKYMQYIGFIQSEQVVAAQAKAKIRYAVSRGRRGLPVSLLRSGTVHTPGGKRHNVCSRDKKVAEIPENFTEKLLSGDFEMLEVLSVEKVSEGEEVEVYDLTVPGVERFIANGVLAHNTSWKAGEIYGTLPVWIERTQKLKFASKGEREPYRYIFEELGLNADAVIGHTDYSEVTRASLRSMSAMEEYYRQLYAERIFYYEQRLPPPHLVAQLPVQQVWDYWLRCFDGRRVFKPDSRAPLYLVREWLQALASVQYGLIDNLSPRQQKFLARSQIAQRIDHTTLTRDLQRTLSLRISPMNRTPLARLDEDDDFSFHRLAATSREERDYKATRQSLLRSEDCLPELQAPDAELPATLENELLSTSTQELLDGLETDRGNPVPEQLGQGS